MKIATARSLAFALAIAGASAATLEGASSRIALSGGPLASSERPAVIALSLPTPARPLQPGEMLVLGPTAGPLSAPAAPAAPALAPSTGAVAPPVDTITVAAPASAPLVSPAPARTWESYRTGNVVRIDLR